MDPRRPSPSPRTAAAISMSISRSKATPRPCGCQTSGSPGPYLNMNSGSGIGYGTGAPLLAGLRGADFADPGLLAQVSSFGKFGGLAASGFGIVMQQNLVRSWPALNY